MTIAEVEQGIRGAIDSHLAGLLEDGQPIPQPSSVVNTQMSLRKRL